MKAPRIQSQEDVIEILNQIKDSNLKFNQNLTVSEADEVSRRLVESYVQGARGRVRRYSTRTSIYKQLRRAMEIFQLFQTFVAAMKNPDLRSYEWRAAASQQLCDRGIGFLPPLASEEMKHWIQLDGKKVIRFLKNVL